MYEKKKPKKYNRKMKSVTKDKRIYFCTFVKKANFLNTIENFYRNTNACERDKRLFYTEMNILKMMRAREKEKEACCRAS